jgi:hypothetical protein
MAPPSNLKNPVSIVCILMTLMLMIVEDKIYRLNKKAPLKKLMALLF